MITTTKRMAAVTGGAEGIGRVYAHRLAEDGFDVIVIDRLPADETLALVESAGQRGFYIHCDLAVSESVDATVARILQDHGGCDVLVNNAAIGSQRGFDDITFPMLQQMLMINLEAPFLLCKGLVPAMRQRGWGRIINIASGALNSSLGGFVDYLITKGGIVGLTRAMAAELGVDGITVNAVAPGLVRTPMTLGGREGQTKLPDEVFDFCLGMQSIKRALSPENLAGVISFFASEDSALMSGQVVYCDGGIVRV